MVLYLRTNPGASKWDQVRFEACGEVWFILRPVRGVLGETQPSLRSAGGDRGWARIPEPLGRAPAGPRESPDTGGLAWGGRVLSWEAPGRGHGGFTRCDCWDLSPVRGRRLTGLVEPGVESGLLLLNCVPAGEARSSRQSASLPRHLRRLLTEGSARQSPREDPRRSPTSLRFNSV